MKRLLSWIKAIELNLLFFTIVLERPNTSKTITRGPVKVNKPQSIEEIKEDKKMGK